MADHPENQRDHWRHRHAMAYARPWRTLRANLASGLITGLAGAIVTAATTSFPAWAAILVGVGAVFVGAYLPWLVMYLFSAATAGGRLMRKDIAEIHALLSEQSSAAPSKKGGGVSSRSPSSELAALQSQIAIAEILLRRLPHQPFVISRATIPPQLAQDVKDWIGQVTNLLSPWPPFQAQFSGTLPLGNDVTDPPLITRDLATRSHILRRACKQIAEDEGRQG